MRRLLLAMALIVPGVAWGQQNVGPGPRIGTTSGTVAAGNDSRITGAAQISGDGGLSLGTSTQTPMVRINGPVGGARGLDWQAAGVDRWHLQMDGSDNIALYSYAPTTGAYVGNPLLIQNSDQTVRLNWPVIMSAYTAPADSSAAGPIFSVHNNGANGGIGVLNQYFSAANALNFDVGVQVIASFNPTTYRSCTTIAGNTCNGPGNLAQFMVSLTPNDTNHKWGQNVAEWNIVNRGLDMGWARDRNAQPTTGGLLMVPEASVFGDTGGGEGKNAGFAYSASRDAGTNSTGDYVKFYNGYLCEPNSMVGAGQAVTTNGGAAESYCLYATGDITGTTAKIPFAPLGFDGNWLHGLSTTKAVFSDGLAVRLAGTGQSFGFDNGTSVAKITGSGSGANEGITFTAAGTGQIQAVAAVVTVGSNAQASSALNLTGASAGTRSLSIQTAGSTRWQIGTDTAAESGSNAGTNLAIYRYSDTGGYLGQVLGINRASGFMNIYSGLQVAAGVTADVYKSGAATGVSCAAGTVSLSTMVVTNGIVTHC